MKYRRSDNDDEYHDRRFKEYCTSNNIRREFIVLQTPLASHHNGVVEYMNKTIMEHAQSMRLHIDLTK